MLEHVLPVARAEMKAAKKRDKGFNTWFAEDTPEESVWTRASLAIIREFLPKQLSEQDTAQAIADAIAKTGAASVKDMGKVMAELKASYAGQIDFGRASGLVKAKLG